MSMSNLSSMLKENISVPLSRSSNEILMQELKLKKKSSNFFRVLKKNKLDDDIAFYLNEMENDIDLKAKKDKVIVYLKDHHFPCQKKSCEDENCTYSHKNYKLSKNQE